MEFPRPGDLSEFLDGVLLPILRQKGGCGEIVTRPAQFPADDCDAVDTFPHGVPFLVHGKFTGSGRSGSGVPWKRLGREGDGWQRNGGQEKEGPQWTDPRATAPRIQRPILFPEPVPEFQQST